VARSLSSGLRAVRSRWRWAVFVSVLVASVVLYRQTRSAASSPLASPNFELKHEGFSGAVQSMFEAGPYTYFNLRLADGNSRWVVVLDRTHRAAKWLAVNSYGLRRRFKSERLGREFDEVYLRLARNEVGVLLVATGAGYGRRGCCVGECRE
jgi:hypothetical protein